MFDDLLSNTADDLPDWLSEAEHSAVRVHHLHINAVGVCNAIGVVQVEQRTSWIECVDHLNPSERHGFADMTDNVSTEKLISKHFSASIKAFSYPNEWPMTWRVSNRT